MRRPEDETSVDQYCVGVWRIPLDYSNPCSLAFSSSGPHSRAGSQRPLSTDARITSRSSLSTSGNASQHSSASYVRAREFSAQGSLSPSCRLCKPHTFGSTRRSCPEHETRTASAFLMARLSTSLPDSRRLRRPSPPRPSDSSLLLSHHTVVLPTYQSSGGGRFSPSCWGDALTFTHSR